MIESPLLIPKKSNIDNFQIPRENCPVDSPTNESADDLRFPRNHLLVDKVTRSINGKYF
ncbi:hypothetical protein J2799_001744 [Chryseobacterium vietnamense]|nr:hypothetical protein [Chryseobacterium vietnamense]